MAHFVSLNDRAPDLDPFRALNPLSILIPSDFVPKNGFPGAKALTQNFRGHFSFFQHGYSVCIFPQAMAFSSTVCAFNLFTQNPFFASDGIELLKQRARGEQKKKALYRQ